MPKAVVGVVVPKEPGDEVGAAPKGVVGTVPKGVGVGAGVAPMKENELNISVSIFTYAKHVYIFCLHI